MAWLRQDTGGQAWLSSPGPRPRQMPEPLLRQYPVSKLQQLLPAASESTRTSLEPKHLEVDDLVVSFSLLR